MSLSNHTIFLTREEYSRTTSGKGWRSKPDTTDPEEQITETQYSNIVSASPFFRNLGGREKHEKSYTSAGYLTTRLTSISPDSSRKIVRKFKMVYDPQGYIEMEKTRLKKELECLEQNT